MPYRVRVRNPASPPSGPAAGRHRSRPPARRPVAALVGTGVVAALLAGSAAAALAPRGASDDAAGPVTPSLDETTVAAPPPPPPPPPAPAVFTLVAAGDVLLHKAVTRSATANGVTDYSAVLSGLDAWVQGADLALCHFETPVVPPGQEVSTYPVFGFRLAPTRLAFATTTAVKVRFPLPTGTT